MPQLYVIHVVSLSLEAVLLADPLIIFLIIFIVTLIHGSRNLAGDDVKPWDMG